MFKKEEFSTVLKQINSNYDTMTDFAKKADFDRSYISKYINMKYDNPPSPEILKKLANASYGIVSYNDLMEMCGYIELSDLAEKKDSLQNQFNKIKLTSKEKKFVDTMLLRLDKIMQFYIDKYKNNPDFSESVFKKEFKRDYQKLLKDLNYNMFSFSAFGFFRVNKALVLGIEIITINRDIDKLIDLDSILVDSDSNSTILDKDSLFNCPVYGRISAGIPNWAEECLESYLPLDPNLMNINNPEECFFLRVNGESMNKLVRNGAYALIRKQDVVENGDIAVVLVDNYDATLKKFTKHGDVVVLEPMSNDPNFQTQIYDKNTDIKILGKYLGKFELN